jgi:hypothetical protein
MLFAVSMVEFFLGHRQVKVMNGELLTVSMYSGGHIGLDVGRIMYFHVCFLVSGNESYSESENSTNDDEDSTHSNEPEVGLRSLIDDDNENEDEMNTEKKVCVIVLGFWYES